MVEQGQLGVAEPQKAGRCTPDKPEADIGSVPMAVDLPALEGDGEAAQAFALQTLDSDSATGSTTGIVDDPATGGGRPGADSNSKPAKPPTAVTAAKAFAGQPKDLIAAAMEVRIPFGRRGGGVTWNVLPAGVEIEGEYRKEVEQEPLTADATKPHVQQGIPR